MAKDKKDGFSHLETNEVGLTLKLMDDGKLAASIGFCFDQDFDKDRADAIMLMMYGVVSLVEDNPEVLLAMGSTFGEEKFAIEQDTSIDFEADPKLKKAIKDIQNSNVINFRKRQ
tara:strand:+ start:3325 stop:3669 length:345 start_codon:yes stop_codon:yes gene_type:complete